MSPLRNESARKRAVWTRDSFLSAQGVHNKVTALCGRASARGGFASVVFSVGDRPASRFPRRFGVWINVSRTAVPARKHIFFSAVLVVSIPQLIDCGWLLLRSCSAQLCGVIVQFNL